MLRVGDFFWAYGDILRSPYGITNNVDTRVLGFMAIKLLCDDKKLNFTFNYKNNFSIKTNFFTNKEKTTQEKFIKIVQNLQDFTTTSKYFKKQDLEILLDEQGFNILQSIKELSNSDFERVLDIYSDLANFKNYPKEDYKDLYELTITRLQDKNYKGDMLGQHFTQKSIIHLMCEMALPNIKERKKIAIYDPTCGSGSMLLESYYYFKHHKNTKGKELEVYGQEFDKKVYLLCNIFLEISDVAYNIAYGDTLLNPAFVDGINGDESFDFIISNPPFGVDWKHSYDDVVKLMKDDKNFLVVKDGKKFITPKKSDGQFLFMLHILKLLLNEKTKKDGFAGVITSSTLLSNGVKTSREAKIREKIFSTSMLKVVIEQPKAMFTNTDITSHIWFFDTTKEEDFTKILKTTNDKKNLFVKHPNYKGKMKHSYSKENIKEIVKFIYQKKEQKYITKNLFLEDRFSINITNDVDSINKNKKTDMQKVSQSFKTNGSGFCKIMQNEVW